MKVQDRRRARLRCASIAAATLLLVIGSWQAHGDEAAKPRRPNIVVILVDDLGYGELGCQGNHEIPTPHIDSIAANGVRFTAGYVTASYCSPSRAGLMSGRYPARFGYDFNPVGHYNEDRDAGLPLSERTLSEHLRDAGYATALIGKWHLGGHATYHPLRHGFDEFYGFLHEGHFFVPPPYRGVTTMLRRKRLPDGGLGRWVRDDGKLIHSTHMGHNEPAYDANNPILRGGQPTLESAYLTDAWTREAIEFIERNKSRPFFLYLAHNAVHSPLQGADAYMERFGHIEDVHRRIFAAMLSNLDDSVGAVLRRLRDRGLEENTLVFLLSDNGGPTRELTSSNKPLRGGKGDVYEGGIRVPFLVQWKGTLPAGKTYERPVISLDIYATALAVAGVPAPRNRPPDGVDLLPYLSGENTGAPHDVLFWRMGTRTAIRAGDWKLLRNPRRGGNAEWQLYDLKNDVAESKNLIEKHPHKARELETIWKRWNNQMLEPAWTPRRP